MKREKVTLRIEAPDDQEAVETLLAVDYKHRMLEAQDRKERRNTRAGCIMQLVVLPLLGLAWALREPIAEHLLRLLAGDY